MVCLSRQYPFKFFKGCLPQILLSLFLNTLSHIVILAGNLIANYYLGATKVILFILKYFNFEPSFKLQWCRGRDLFGSQISVTTGRFELRIS